MAGFVFRVSPFTLLRPEYIGLLFGTIFEAIKLLAGKFSAGGEWKFEDLGDQVFEFSSHGSSILSNQERASWDTRAASAGFSPGLVKRLAASISEKSGSGLLARSSATLAGSTCPEVVFLSTMRYRVELYPSDEGFAVSCPRLPGCWSQGATEEEALENIRVAIQEYLAAQLPGLSAERLDHLYVEVFVEAPPPARGEALARVRRVLASLPARDAEVLRTVFLEDVGRDEIARRFGIDRDYVRIVLQRAKEKFRRMYLDDEADLRAPAPSRDHGFSEVREVEVTV